MFSQASHNSRLTPVEPVPGGTELIARVSELMEDLSADHVDLLKAFHRIQHQFGYVPREAVPLLAGKFRTTPAIIYGTIDFYSEVRIAPPAEATVEWCSGPACLLKGSLNIRRALEAILECEMNRTSSDGKFGLRLVQCDGTCHLAPLVRYQGRYIRPLTVSESIEWARRLTGDDRRAPPEDGARPAADEASPELAEPVEAE